MVSQKVQQLLRNRSAEQTVGGFGIVTIGSESARLILHLHHQDSTICLIDALYVLQQSRKRMRVCFHGRAAKWRDDFGLLASRVLHTTYLCLSRLTHSGT